jgi:tagatose 6-phosphate kinase
MSATQSKNKRANAMILCIGTTPAAQRVMIFRKLTIDSVNRAATTLEGAAGKAVNVAKVLKALGEHPVATGFLGGDRGASLLALLKAKRIDLDFVTVPERTRECITVIDNSSSEQTELVEESQPVADIAYRKLFQLIKRRVHDCRAVVMSGTITPGGPVDFYYRCTRIARHAGALPVVDAQGAVLIESLQARPGLVKPNRAELATTVGRKLETESALIRAMRELHERGAERVVVTAGREPALAFDGKTCWKVISPRVRAVNPIGSGDAFTAAMVWRLTRGEDLGEACRWASASGAANALSAMPGEVNRQDVERLAQKARAERIA